MRTYSDEAWPSEADDDYLEGAPGGRENQSSGDGMIDPSMIVGFLRRHWIRIGVVTVVLTTICLLIFQLVPFPYKSTALVLVDPRERRVTLTENVLPGIGTDAAVLESVVQIVQSDGFLRPVLASLQANKDPIFQSSVGSSPSDDRELLAAFKKKLSVDRLGATFVVEISFLSPDSERSAHYANGVARAFVDSQKTSQVVATETAASSLSERLHALRTDLETSEQAVASFRSKQGIVGVTDNNTLQQRELIALNDQIAVANAATEAARAQYDQFRSGSIGGGSLIEQSDAAQLTELRRQRGLVMQRLSEFNRIFGDRHPEVIAERSKLTSLDSQLATENRRMLEVRKERLDSAVAAQKALEHDLASLKAKAGETDAAMVELGALEREAAADRKLYEDFLERFKATDEQSGLEIEQAQLASPATPALKTTRPSLVLAGLVFGILSGAVATAYALLIDLKTVMRSQVRYGSILKGRSRSEQSRSASVIDAVRGLRIAATAETSRGLHAVPDHGERSQVCILGRVPNLSSAGHLNESDFNLQLTKELLRSSVRSQLNDVLRPGGIVLVSSLQPNVGKSGIAQGFATLAGLQGLSTVLLKADALPSRRRVSAQQQLISGCPVAIIDPSAMSINGEMTRISPERFMEGYVESAVSQTGCLVVDASVTSPQCDIDTMAEYCDAIFVVVDPRSSNREEAIEMTEYYFGNNDCPVDIILNEAS